MVSSTAVVRNPLGLHARLAVSIACEMRRFQSSVTVALAHSGRAAHADARSPIELLSLGAGPNSTVTVGAEGPDEAPAMHAICRLVESS